MKKLFNFIAVLSIINFSLYAQIKVTNRNHNHQSSSVSVEQMNALNQLQRNAVDVQIAWNEFNPTPTFLIGKLTSNGYINNFQSAEKAAKNFLTENKILFNLNSPSEEFGLLKSEIDNLGMTHVKLQQYYKGLRVIGSQIIVHFDQQRAISSINGRYIPTLKLSNTPSINEEESKIIASKYCNGTQTAAVELAIYINENQPVLAYEVQVPTKMAPKQRVIVDAQNGNVLYKDTGIRYDGPDTGSGIGLKGDNRALNIYLSSGKYYLIDASKPMYVPPIGDLNGVIVTLDAKNSTNENNPYDLIEIVTDPNNDKNFNDNDTLRAAVDVHYYSENGFEYYKNKFTRNSWDNNGGSLKNVVHYNTNYNNAFWNGVFMSYGDGDGNTFSNFAGAYDIVVHEITHAVTSSTANLEYQGQSGALNESYSDVFAAMADNDDWQIGEDIYTPSINGDAPRDMSDPHQGGTSLNDPGWQPADMNEYLYLPYTEDQDYGKVHTNSGIPNKACYLVANQIGREKTEQIYYRTLTYYLTPKSQFIDARNATLQSAADLYGAGSAEYNAVTSAFDNVGITSNLPKTNELAYDDGNPETKIYETDANWGIVNRLTAPGNSTIMNVEFYYGGDNSSGNGSFKIKIYDDGGNKPGSLLLDSNPVTPPAGSQNFWYPYPIGTSSLNLNVSGDFYVGIFYDGTNQPLIGADTTVINGRAWERDNTKWIQLDENSYFPVTLLIRAIVNTVTGVHQISNEVPDDFALSQNYPNPFNSSTNIEFYLPKESKISLIAYDVMGRKVWEYENNGTVMNAGKYEIQWDGKTTERRQLASGIYLIQLRTAGFVDVKKVVLLK